jgi:hypothetical protein
MNRARLAVAAAFVAASCVAGTALAQSQEPLKPILAGKKFTPPLRGAADIDFIKPATTRKGDTVVTTIKLKNASNAPVARLKVDETWYDKGGATVAGGTGVLDHALQPGEVQTLTIETPYNPKMSSNNWTFSHANGSVKPHRVDKFDGPKDAAKEAPKTAKKK